MSETPSAEKDAAVETFHDELDAHIAESMKDPEFRGAFEDAGARHAILDGLLAERRALGLTQTEIGRRMGNIKQATVSEFESEPSDPRLSTIQRYARAVGLRLIVTLECRNGHPFEPGMTVDDAPGESHPDWCNVCGEARVLPPAVGREARP